MQILKLLPLCVSISFPPVEPKGCVLWLFYLVIHSGFGEAQFPLPASCSDCVSFIKDGHCVLNIEPIIQLSILALGGKVHTVSSEGRLTDK